MIIQTSYVNDDIEIVPLKNSHIKERISMFTWSSNESVPGKWEGELRQGTQEDLPV